MLAMSRNVAGDNWAELLPFIKFAHNTSCRATKHGPSFFLVFGRQARLRINIIIEIRHMERTRNTQEYAQSTRENLQLAASGSSHLR